MLKLGLLALIASALSPAGQQQSPASASAVPEGPKPPAKVDRALRDRVTKFYQAHVDGKYRIAEQYIADDSKDVYYAAEKPKYLKFEIRKITYADDFKTATVVVQCEQEIRHHTIGTMTIPTPQESFWKVEKGQWFWYVDPAVVRTPMGIFRRGATPAAPQPQSPGARPGGRLAARMPNADALLGTVTNAVRADKSELRLGDQTSSGLVVLTNSMPGSVTLKAEVVPETAGLTVKLENDQLGPKQNARMLFRYAPVDTRPQSPVTVTVTVEPTGQKIPITVLLAATQQRTAASAAQPQRLQVPVVPLPSNAPPPGAMVSIPTAAPSIQTITPARAVAGARQSAISISGARFAAGAKVLFDKHPLRTTYGNAALLTVAIPDHWLANPRKIEVRVQNPDGKLSDPVMFDVIPAK